MDAARIEVVPRTRWPRLAPFIHACNGDGPALRCLHSHVGPRAADYAAELRKLSAAEARFVAAWDGAHLCGVAGAEFDPSSGRAWLRGPFVAADRPFAPLAAALHDALMVALPPTLVQFDAFVGAGCAEAISLYRSLGYEAGAGDDELTLDLGSRKPPPMSAGSPGLTIRAPQPAWRDTIAALHGAEFASPYLSTQQLLGRQPPDRITRVALLDGVPVGYMHAHFDAEWHEGYIDFVAVLPAVRRRGVARALVEAAIDWSCRRHRARGVTLTVRRDRAGARALYLSLGFAHVRTGIGLRRRTAAPAT
jgi:ribosomal-protein-alanine N-acetyltransferase